MNSFLGVRRCRYVRREGGQCSGTHRASRRRRRIDEDSVTRQLILSATLDSTRTYSCLQTSKLDSNHEGPRGHSSMDSSASAIGSSFSFRPSGDVEGPLAIQSLMTPSTPSFHFWKTPSSLRSSSFLVIPNLNLGRSGHLSLPCTSLSVKSSIGNLASAPSRGLLSLVEKARLRVLIKYSLGTSANTDLSLSLPVAILVRLCACEGCRRALCFALSSSGSMSPLLTALFSCNCTFRFLCELRIFRGMV